MGDGRTVPRLATFLGRRSGDTNSDTTETMLGSRDRTSNDLSEKEQVGSLFEGARASLVWIDVFVRFFLRGVNVCSKSWRIEMVGRIMRRLSLQGAPRSRKMP